MICECATDRDINVFILLRPRPGGGAPQGPAHGTARLASRVSLVDTRVETSSVDLATCGLVAEFSFAVQTHTDVDVMHHYQHKKSY